MFLNTPVKRACPASAARALLGLRGGPHQAGHPVTIPHGGSTTAIAIIISITTTISTTIITIVTTMTKTTIKTSTTTSARDHARLSAGAWCPRSQKTNVQGDIAASYGAGRSPRGIAVGRRNWTFYGSDHGGPATDQRHKFTYRSCP